MESNWLSGFASSIVFCVDKLLDYKLRGKDWTGTGRVGTNPNDIHTDEILLFLRLPSSFRLENRPVCFVDCYLHWWRTNVCQITTLASLYPQQEKAQRSGRRFSCSPNKFLMARLSHDVSHGLPWAI